MFHNSDSLKNIGSKFAVLPIALLPLGLAMDIIECNLITHKNDFVFFRSPQINLLTTTSSELLELDRFRCKI
jgi:hypothetical protein